MSTILAGKPFGSCLGAQPGQLALSELTGCRDATFDHGVIVIVHVEIPPHLAITKRTHGWHVWAQITSLTQAHHFVDKALRQHLPKSCFNSRMQPRTILGRNHPFGKRIWKKFSPIASL